MLVIGAWFGFIAGYSRGYSKGVRDSRSDNCRRDWTDIALYSNLGGGICLLVAAGTALHALHFVMTSVRTTGTIVELVEKGRDGEGAARFSPRFTFRDTLGNEHVITASVATSPAPNRVGDQVPVLYRPDDPKEAKIDRFPDVWGLPFVTGILGGLAVIVGQVLPFWPRICSALRATRT